jgi:hypothetical protein
MLLEPLPACCLLAVFVGMQAEEKTWFARVARKPWTLGKLGLMCVGYGEESKTKTNNGGCSSCRLRV